MKRRRAPEEESVLVVHPSYRGDRFVSRFLSTNPRVVRDARVMAPADGAHCYAYLLPASMAGGPEDPADVALREMRP